MSEIIEVWTELQGLLKRKLLISLLGISKEQFKQYRAEPKSIPLGVFVRLEFLKKLTDILKGGYNQKGVRYWFGRPRRRLDGFTPVELLSGRWWPDGPGPQRVLELAKGMNI